MIHFKEVFDVTKYEVLDIEIIKLSSEDVITTSIAFDGEDDDIDGDWK